MIQSVKANVGALPRRALADTGYRSEQVFEALASSDIELVVALGREGKRQLHFDPQAKSHTLATEICSA